MAHHVLVRSYNTSVVSYINHQGICGHIHFANCRTKSSCGPKGSCCLFEHNIGADILQRQGLSPEEWRLHPEVMELIWREFDQAQVDLFVSREISHCPLWFSLTHSSSSWTGRDGADVAEASSVCISPDRSAHGSPEESSLGPGFTTSHCPVVARQSMVPRYNIPSRWASSGAPHQEGPSVPSRGLDISPPTRTVKLWAWPLRRPRSLNQACSDHSPLQSSLHEKNVCLEVESFHFMV